jgi:ATP-dependent RNA helicase RhlE
MSFDLLGLSEPLLRAVQSAGYTTPTDIQRLAIPPALSGEDVLGRAKTGSGKTAAFVLPVLDRLFMTATTTHRAARPVPGRIRALVLAPTRELAQQIHQSARTYGRYVRLRSDAHFGGVSIEPQIDRLRQGVDLLAATPGRLLDHLMRGTVDLSACEVLIVDEADRMFDMGFINDVKRIIAQLPAKRQTLLFSATINDDVRKLAAVVMREPVRIEVGVERNPAESVRQRFLAVEKEEKIDLLSDFLTKEQGSTVLVFSRTKHGADKISKRLQRMNINTAVLHSNRSQNQRTVALDAFKSGRIRVLIATDIAARGIDVHGITYVINYDTPTFAEDYIHRIGRTGRAELTGDAITYVSRDERVYLKRIESFTGLRFHLETLDGTRLPDRTFQHRQAAISQSGESATNGATSERSFEQRRDNGGKRAPERRNGGDSRRGKGDARGGQRQRGERRESFSPGAIEELFEPRAFRSEDNASEGRGFGRQFESSPDPRGRRGAPAKRTSGHGAAAPAAKATRKRGGSFEERSDAHRSATRQSGTTEGGRKRDPRTVSGNWRSAPKSGGKRGKR